MAVQPPNWGTREKILMTAGIVLIFGSWVNADVLGRAFHYDFVIAGLALCGISLTLWRDKK